MIAEATLRVRVFRRIEKVQIELRPGVEVYLRQVLVDLGQARAKPRAGRIERIDIHAQTAAERDTDTLPSLAHHPVRWQDRGVQLANLVRSKLGALGNMALGLREEKKTGTARAFLSHTHSHCFTVTVSYRAEVH